ncbi:MAG: ATP-binding protein [Chloroflexi bacterium]|nr:ATP-binding protein [Chloroflexota bacterium]
MTTLADVLASIVLTSTIEETTSKSLAVMAEYFQPERAGLVLWDHDMGRYIIGQSLSVTDDVAAGEAWRTLLSMANGAFAGDHTTPRQVTRTVFYDPLNVGDHHIGAFLFVNSRKSPDLSSRDVQLLRRVIAHTLKTVMSVENAGHIQRQLEEDRQRLAHLLEAVNKQQRTIDHLLALEREFSAQLEEKVRERTEALQETQRRLMQSEKLALIGKLASSLMHEVNNPLQAIQSGLGLVVDALNLPETSLVGQDLATIQSELERIQIIFRQLLDLNRPNIQQHYRPLDLNMVCTDTLVLMRKRLHDLGVDIHCDLDEHLPLTCGDLNQMKQVLLNLLLNAAEAVPEDQGHIRVATYAGQDSVHLAVMDNGAGMETETMKHLFEPLFTTKTRGLGLGLSVSLDIVQRHQGTITVDSSPTMGTTFLVSLPVRSDCDDPIIDCG